MVTYDDFVSNGLCKTKYEQLGGDIHDISTDEADMYKIMTITEALEISENHNIGILSILSSNGLF